MDIPITNMQECRTRWGRFTRGQEVTVVQRTSAFNPETAQFDPSVIVETYGRVSGFTLRADDGLTILIQSPDGDVFTPEQLLSRAGTVTVSVSITVHERKSHDI